MKFKAFNRALLLVIAVMMFSGSAILPGCESVPDGAVSNEPVLSPYGLDGEDDREHTLSPQVTQAPPMVSKITTNEESGRVCTTIDFEGIGDLSPIPEFDGITSPGWLGLIDFDAGGSGNFAFEPSPSTIAFWLGDPAGWREIHFAYPVSSLEFLYCSYVTITLEAFDADGNLVDTASGPANWNQGPGGDPSGDFNKWDPLGVQTDDNIIKKVRISGNVNQTGIDDLSVCRRGPLIDSIEFTQAIQQWQTLDDLKADLAGDGEPPVPIVAKKPLALRIYMQEVGTVTDVRVEITGVASESKSVVLQPGCTPEGCRRQQGGCQSVDFYFTPPEGTWTVTVKTFDKNNNEIESHDLTFISKESDALVLRAVSVFDSQDANGNWQGVPANTLGGLIVFLRTIAPTDDVRVDTTGHQVRRDTASYASMINWWDDTVQDINDLYSLWDRFLGLFGQQRYYFGMVRASLPGGIGGMANDIPARGAASRTSAIRLGVETNDEVVAHETGHMLGQRHTHTDQPQATGGTPPGCYSLARDSGTSWPYADNTLQSGPSSSPVPEVGFDVGTGSVLLPEDTFELMSYCTPRWISPHTYLGMLEILDPPPVEPRGDVGAFWLVSGVIEDSSAELRPLYMIETLGPSEAGNGTHRIEVRDADGIVLFTRFFTPVVACTETVDEDFEGPPSFSELVPVQDGAHSILILSPDHVELGGIVLGGSEPVVTVTSPTSGETLNGSHFIAWSVNDPDSTNHTFRVQYSADQGASWRSLATGLTEPSLVVDFDHLPGSLNDSLIRVFASDGVNTGSATSDPFTVSMKLPEAKITFPEDGALFQLGQLVWLQGLGFDGDDGFLNDVSLLWESNIDGFLGNGEGLPLFDLSEDMHIVTLTATDSDGNSASDTIIVQVDGTTPQLALSVVPDGIPTRCVQVTINASDEAEGSGLATVEYSLNAGETWNEVSPDNLPFSFIVPGRGFFHLVVRVSDMARNLAARDDRFFIEEECEQVNLSPIADADGPYSVDEGETVPLDGTGSYDPDGDPLTYEWDLDNDGVFETLGPIPVFSAAGRDGLDTQQIGLRVCDPSGDCDTATGVVTINNVAPVVVASSGSQDVQYSDFISAVTFNVTDVAADAMIASTSWSVDGGGFTAGLPDFLALTNNGCIVSDGTNSCTWTLEGIAGVPQGEYTVRVTVEDDDGGQTVADSTTTVLQEDATVTFDLDNEVAVQVDTPGGESGLFSLTVRVTETVPDLPDGTSDPGDVNLADVSMSLVPVGPGQSASPSACTASIDGTGYESVLRVTCDFDNVRVNTYSVLVMVNGGYYTGFGEDVLVVYDPSLGFATGGGWFYWPDTDEKTNFGFTMKYNKRGTRVRGNLLLIRHLANGTTYRIKSNAIYGLSLGESEDPTFGWASFSGKATYKEPNWIDPVGNYRFITYVEDWNEPGKGYDQFWIKVYDKDHNTVLNMSMDPPAFENVVTLNGGNIVVPHK